MEEERGVLLRFFGLESFVSVVLVFRVFALFFHICIMGVT